MTVVPNFRGPAVNAGRMAAGPPLPEAEVFLVKMGMVGRRHQDEVQRVIIKPVAVSVMDVLLTVKRASNVVGHYLSMFENVSAPEGVGMVRLPNHPVSVLYDDAALPLRVVGSIHRASPAWVSGLRGGAAGARTEYAADDLPRMTENFDAAVSAGV